MKLATLEIIESLTPANNADKLEIVKLVGLGWQIVAQKGIHKVHDVVLFVPIDTVVQRAHWNEFLFKNPDDKTARVNKVRLRGNLSMGIVIPAAEVSTYLPIGTDVFGTDVSAFLGISKYEKPLPMSGEAIGHRPAFIQMTDEDNLQSIPNILKEIVEIDLVETLKLDGTSLTAYRKDGHFGVCSRQLELKEGNNAFWVAVKKYGIDKLLPEGFAIQGELVGPGIQGNPLGLATIELRVFNVIDIEKQRYFSRAEIEDFLAGHFYDHSDNYPPRFPDLCAVPKLDEPLFPRIKLKASVAEIIEAYQKYVDGLTYPNGKPAEGIVVRTTQTLQSSLTSTGIVSFKIINSLYKD
jgi:RNA ligase (TIGR02306 family)